jgi:alkanesulfonate monooxygenase
MGITLHWFLPTSGDSRNVVPGSGGHGRPASIDYLAQIARAADALGFESVLTPTGTHCEDAWLVTAALSQQTTRLKFLVAFRPGITNPTLAAQQAATFQRITNGRLVINIVTGGDSFEQRRFGDWLTHDERYARTDEFMKILRGAWSGEPFDFAGWHYKVRGATTQTPPDPVSTCTCCGVNHHRWPGSG